MTREAADRLSIAVSIAAALLFAAIGWNSSRDLETLWDEAVDHDIAVDLMRHPIAGSAPTLDASQMRLPMYVCAAVFGVTGRDDLKTARCISLVVGAVTIIATGALARACFGPMAAGLAVVLLALSPYFISFGRISMTEGDVFFACFSTLALWALVRHLHAPSPRTWLLTGLLLACAVGSKLFAIFLIPVSGVMMLAAGARPAREAAEKSPDTLWLYRLLALQLAVLVATAGLAWFSRTAAVFGWLALAALWCMSIRGALRSRVDAAGPWPRFLSLTVFALVSCCVLMPVHITDHQIAREILRRLLRWDNSFPLALWDDHLRLYAGILLVKLTVPLGIVTCIALVFAAFRERDDGRWRACVLSFVFYVVIICLLPLRQTFYLMGVYPAIIVLTAALSVEIHRWLRARSARAAPAWAVVVVTMVCHLGWRARSEFPWYHLYGYDTVGDRWLGAESRGYRNLIQTPSDGVESLVRWCTDGGKVKRGDRVVSYLWEERIIRGVMPAEPHFIFVPRGVTPDSATVPPAPSIDSADFVLLHINNLLGYGDLPPDWPPPELLAARFEVVHSVRRGRLAVGWVYARRD